MNEQEYIKNRLDDQIHWYGKKSGHNQKCFKRLKWIEFGLSASIPVIILLYPYCDALRILTAIIGAILTILAAIHGLSDFHENWIEYRATAEMLKHEKYLYFTRAGVYTDTEDAFKLLVERVEQIISKENITWATHSKSIKCKK